MPRVQCLYNYRLHVITQHTHTHVYLLNPEMIPPTCGESQHISVVCLVTDTDTDYYRARECIVALIPHHMQNQQYVTRGRSQVKCCLSSGASVCVGIHASISMAILYEDIDNCIL